MQNQPTPGQWIAMISGAVMFIFSFFNWQSFAGAGVSAWSGVWFPWPTWAPIFGLLIAVILGLQLFAGVQLPNEVGGFSLKQIYLVLAIFTILTTIGFLISQELLAIGFWLNFLGSIGLTAGTGMMLYTEGEQTAAPGSGGPAQPF